MSEKIKRLNRRILKGDISIEQYRREADRLLRGLEWQRRIKYDNMLYM